MRVGRHRHAGHADRSEERAVGIEDLDAAVAAVGDVDVAARIGRDTVRRVELALLRPLLAPRLHPVAVLRKLCDAGIDVAVADEDVALRVPGDVRRLPELAIHVRAWRRDARPRDGFVRRFLLPSEDHRDASVGRELHDHVGSLVDDPDVVVAVYAHGMRVREGVEVLPDFAHEVAVSIEFQELRRGSAERRSGRAAAREDEDVMLRVDGDARHLAEVDVRRQLEELGIGIEGNVRSGLLSKRESGNEDRRHRCSTDANRVWHLHLPYFFRRDLRASCGRASMTCPSLPRMVSPATSALTIASSVAWTVAEKSALIRSFESICTVATSRVLAAPALAVEKAMKISPDPLPDVAPVRARPRDARRASRSSWCGTSGASVA